MLEPATSGLWRPWPSSHRFPSSGPAAKATTGARGGPGGRTLRFPALRPARVADRLARPPTGPLLDRAMRFRGSGAVRANGPDIGKAVCHHHTGGVQPRFPRVPPASHFDMVP